jgi:Domain of unknown function (DUF4331)
MLQYGAAKRYCLFLTDMSHHFDTPTAREDPRINLCDFYLFRGAPGTVVMALTGNPDAGAAGPDTFREEGLYAFRFDLDGDAREDVTFKFRFGEVIHADANEHQHVQSFEVRRATAQSARSGAEGECLIEGRTGQIAMTGSGIRAFAGLVPDLFAGDAAALGKFRSALYKEDKFAPEAFQSRKNFFEGRNVTALEIPSRLVGAGQVRAWATVSLYGHAPEVQVSRWGLPLITNIFMPDINMREDYNRAVPADDVARFSSQISEVVEKVTKLARSAANPAEYAKELIARICPTTLPYTIDSEAFFGLAGFNGRGLADDVMDVMLALTTNTGLGDGVAPDQRRIRATFPYFGEPYTSSEQGAETK